MEATARFMKNGDRAISICPRIYSPGFVFRETPDLRSAWHKAVTELEPTMCVLFENGSKTPVVVFGGQEGATQFAVEFINNHPASADADTNRTR